MLPFIGGMGNDRGKFQFEGSDARRAEALRNVKEALQHTARCLPAAPAAEQAPAATPAGSAFRRVCEILGGK